MGTLSFCRLKLRRGRRLLKRPKSPGPKSANDNHNSNKANDIKRPPSGRRDPSLHEPTFKLNVLQDPIEATVDIVAIHGLGSDFASWGLATDKGKSWLTTLLPTDIPTARVITFSHTPRASHHPLRDTICHLAFHLLQGLRSLRLEHSRARRPIIFIPHSLAGLVVQHALVIARDARDPASRDVYLATRGLMYFGVPGPCSDLARLQGVLADISRITTPQPLKNGKTKDKALWGLESFAADAVALEEGMMDFERIRERLHSASACFCETVPSSTPSGRFIVDQDCVARAAEQVMLRRSHADLMRFDDGSDEGYVALRDWIAHLIDPMVLADELQALQPGPDQLNSLADGRVPTIALTGETGSGRTFLARQFSLRVSRTSGSVFWLNAASRETLFTSYLEVGRKIRDYYWDKYSPMLLSLHGYSVHSARAWLGVMLGLPDLDELLDMRDFKDLDKVRASASVKAITSWFLYPKNEWLLVLDDVGYGVDLFEFLPLKLNGLILLIPQSGDFGNVPPGTVAVEVPAWSETEAFELLLAESRQPHDPCQEQPGLNIVRSLGCKPSSIIHTASLIRQRGVSFQDYLTSTSDVAQALGNAQEHPRKDQISEVVAVASALSDEPLPLDLLVSIENAAGTRLSGDSGCAWWSHSGPDTRRTRVIDSLKELNLVEHVVGSEPPLFRLPAPTRASFGAGEPRQAWLASSACASTIKRQKIGPSTLSAIQAFGRFILPHVLACHERIEHLARYEPSKRDPRRIDFSVLGELCVTQGFPVQAISFFELALREDALGEAGLDSAPRAEAMFSLAMLYEGVNGARCDELLEGIELRDEAGEAEDAGEANLEYRARLAKAERLLARGHSEDALAQFQWLANTYSFSAPLPVNSGFVPALRRLAGLYGEKGHPESAAECRTSVVALYRSLLGPSHPSTLEEEERRALALAETASHHAALGLLEGCLAMRAAVGANAGERHPDMSVTRFRIAVLLDSCLEYEKADGWFLDGLVGMEGVLGEYHPVYLDAKEKLGACFRGRAERAEVWDVGGSERARELAGVAADIFQDVVSAREEVSMDAGRTRNRLGEVLKYMEQLDLRDGEKGLEA
ncbi:uncharacterized protein DNG_01818 [Cephalotrichum gorgonifer]|uniref:Uncharacterized protein n=1 Tax=Cephalotrichum gorgonifer TaxID=2041049 RepID=A0AAE8MRM3_9PEZI|nr:uncharacterized protein DNG_01818 [Cephalotrichum gorgonifer]